MDINYISGQIVTAAMEVHNNLGPGLLERAYEECLCLELLERNISFERQVELPITYKGKAAGPGYRMDLLVEDLIIVELKSVESVHPVHVAQLFTYMKLSGKNLGLLLNFNTKLMKDGIRRIIF